MQTPLLQQIQERQTQQVLEPQILAILNLRKLILNLLNEN